MTTIQKAHQTATEMQRHIGAGAPYVQHFTDGAVPHVELGEDIDIFVMHDGRFCVTVLADGYTGETAKEAVHAAVAGCQSKARVLRKEAFELDRLAETIKAASPNLWPEQQ
jgi:hypothetical protein